MTNSWSLLYHTINGTLDEVFPTMTNSGIGTHSKGGWVDQLGINNISIDTSNCPIVSAPELEKPPVHYKYNEDKILEKTKEYIGRTYSSHYAYNDRVQTLDLIEAVGDASAFCRSNILKYASRYDKKGTTRLDIEKIIHYAVLLYHFEGLDQETTNGYETF